MIEPNDFGMNTTEETPMSALRNKLSPFLNLPVLLINNEVPDEMLFQGVHVCLDSRKEILRLLTQIETEYERKSN